LLQRRVIEPMFGEEGVKAAQRTHMRRLDPGDVVRRGAGLARNGQDLGLRHVDEFGITVDETLDQPGAGDAVDSWALRDHAARLCTRTGWVAISASRFSPPST
jgi:hypothetical protein